MRAAATAGRKPWRYYYVMAFPLTASIAQDKLQEVTEMTAAIEQREEDYLRKVAARNAAHAAALEAERKAVEDKGKPTMADHVAWVLRRLRVVSALLLLAVVVVFYKLYWRDKAHQDVPRRVVQGTMWSVGILLVVNVMGWIAAYRRSLLGARILMGVELGLIVGLALLLDEMRIVHESQARLHTALTQGPAGFTKDALDLIVNGGTKPSLVQRFVFDAPSQLLRWMRMSCSASTSGYAAVAIDKHEFFSPFWNRGEKACVTTALQSCLLFGEIIQPIVIGALVITGVQVILTGIFIALAKPNTSRRTYKRRKQQPHSKASTPAILSAGPNNQFFRLVTFMTALFGSSNTIAGANLLQFCSIADFETLFTWILVVCLLSGISALFASLFVGCQWKQQLAGVLLVIAVASEAFMLAEFIKIAAKHIGPGLSVEGDQDKVEWLRVLYNQASGQTCSSIKRWISHVCVDTTFIPNQASFDVSCQREFVALLLATFNLTDSYLAWSIGMKLLLLVQLVLPALRQAVVNVVSILCCLSSEEKIAATAIETNLKQPSIGYDDALELYLESIRSKDSARREAEREAFEKEWSLRTGRVLSDIRTPHVVITPGDFGAIVRTLLLRRMTLVCKLDLSLNVSNDGRLLLVRIFASDNLLLATLCETTYRLQFADTIDPGRQFWRNRKEVNEDQKILDGPTVKHKLRLLLKENVMPPKEAVWFPGESLARVSARVHALSRASRALKGQLRPLNPAPPFATYSPKLQCQYLYKKYLNKLDIPDTYRRSAVLRTVDCIRLTRGIIDTEFDIHATIDSGLVSSFHCLHSSSRYDWNSREVLASNWVAFWRPTHLPGEFKDHAVLNMLGRFAPFRQPLQDVRDYFGEMIAMYFAWLAFYAKMIMLPAAAATVILCKVDHSMFTELWGFYSHTTGKQGPGSKNILSRDEQLLSLGLVAWGFTFAKMWDRKSVWYQLQWGVSDAAATIVTKTDDDSPNSSNLDATQKPSFYSGFAGLHQRLSSWLCVLVLGAINVLVVLALVVIQGPIAGIAGERLAVASSCVCQAFFMQWNGGLISNVAHALSKWENPNQPAGHPSYQKSVVSKLFSLQFLNTFSGLFLLGVRDWGCWVTIVRWVSPLRPLYNSYSVHIGGRVTVLIEMQSLLIAYFLVCIGSHVFTIVYSTSQATAKRWAQQFTSLRQEDETLLSPYRGPHESYAQVVVQLGLVVTFSGVCPILPLLSLVECAVKLRSDAVDLCYNKQRPEPGNGCDDDLECWSPFVLLMLKVSVPMTLAVIIFTADNYDSVPLERRVGWWLIGVVGILLLSQLFWVLVHRETRLVEEARARNIFLVERYFGRAEVTEQKSSSSTAIHSKSADVDISDVQEAVPSVEESLHQYEERLELLRRLDVALRKRSELGNYFPSPTETAGVLSTTTEKRVEEGYVSEEKASQSMMEEHAAQPLYREGGATATRKLFMSNVVEKGWATEEGHTLEEVEGGEQRTESEGLRVTTSINENEQRNSGATEEMIVGYFRPIPGVWPPPQPALGRDEDPVSTATDVASTDAPLRQQTPRRLSVMFGKPQSGDVKIGGSSSVEQQQSPRRQSMMFMAPGSSYIRINTEDEGSAKEAEPEEPTPSRPAPLRLSKLFKRVPPPSSGVDTPAFSDDVDTPLLSSSSTSQLTEVPLLQADIEGSAFVPGDQTDPDVLMTMELVKDSSHEATQGELLEEKAEISTTDSHQVDTVQQEVESSQLNVSAAQSLGESPPTTIPEVEASAIPVDESTRIYGAVGSPSRRLSVLSRQSNPPESSKKEESSSEDSEAELTLSVPQRPFSPRLSFLSRKPKRSVKEESGEQGVEGEAVRVATGDVSSSESSSVGFVQYQSPRRRSMMFMTPGGDQSRPTAVLQQTETPMSAAEASAIPLAVSGAVDSPSRRFSPRLSFLSRKSRARKSSRSEGSSSKDSHAEPPLSAPERQLSPRLSFLSPRSRRSVSKVSDSSEDSQVALIAPEPPAPRKLSKLFRRVQPSALSMPDTSATLPVPSEAVASTAPTIATDIVASDVEVPPASLTILPELAMPDTAETEAQYDGVDFLAAARAELALTQAPLTTPPRRPSGGRPEPPSPPPVYSRVELAGLEAVREAASRRQFDFSADD